MYHDDPFDLERFTTAQSLVYDTVIEELLDGRKRTHWMGYVFPQFAGLGHSDNARYYAVKSLDEARAYLEHPDLGPRLLECAEAVLDADAHSVSEIFDSPDDLKLKSCMTLFERAAGPDSVFSDVLERYFDGERDDVTLYLLEQELER